MPTSGLTGLELRKAVCEAMSIKHSRFCTRVNGGLKCDCREMDLPAVESDPAVSEPLTDGFCKQRGYEFTVSSFTDGIYNCAFFRMVGGIADRITSCDGRTPSEARARAIVMTARGRTSKNVSQ